MKKVAERLKAVTSALLKEKNASPETYKAYQEELRALRELIATHKALATFREDFGDDLDDDEQGAPRSKRTSNEQWD